MLRFLAGIIFAVAAIAGAAVAAVYTGAIPSGADTVSDEPALLDAVKLYGTNCAACHGASDAKPSKLAQGFYIRAPQLAKNGVEDDPPEASFWRIKHGIRFTAMPGFVKTLSDDDMWKLANFVNRMDNLPSKG